MGATSNPAYQFCDKESKTRPPFDRGLTRNELAEKALYSGRPHANLPGSWEPPNVPDCLHLTYYQSPQKSLHAFDSDLPCYHPKPPEESKKEDKPSWYVRDALDHQECIQRMQASNERRTLDLQKPEHDTAEMRRLMDLSSYKQQSDTFYDHEGRYLKERTGTSVSSYNPGRLEYEQTCGDKSGAAQFDLTTAHRGSLEVKTQLNADMAKLDLIDAKYNRSLCGCVPQVHSRPSPHEVYEPFSSAKTHQTQHLTPAAIGYDANAHKGNVTWCSQNPSKLQNHDVSKSYTHDVYNRTSKPSGNTTSQGPEYHQPNCPNHPSKQHQQKRDTFLYSYQPMKQSHDAGKAQQHQHYESYQQQQQHNQYQLPQQYQHSQYKQQMQQMQQYQQFQKQQSGQQDQGQQQNHHEQHQLHQLPQYKHNCSFKPYNYRDGGKSIYEPPTHSCKALHPPTSGQDYMTKETGGYQYDLSYKMKSPVPCPTSCDSGTGYTSSGQQASIATYNRGRNQFNCFSKADSLTKYKPRAHSVPKTFGYQSRSPAQLRNHLNTTANNRAAKGKAVLLAN